MDTKNPFAIIRPNSDLNVNPSLGFFSRRDTIRGDSQPERVRTGGRTPMPNDEIVAREEDELEEEEEADDEDEDEE